MKEVLTSNRGRGTFVFPDDEPRIPKYTVEEIQRYWENTLKKELRDGALNRLSDDEWV